MSIFLLFITLDRIKCNCIFFQLGFVAWKHCLHNFDNWHLLEQAVTLTHIDPLAKRKWFFVIRLHYSISTMRIFKCNYFIFYLHSFLHNDFSWLHAFLEIFSSVLLKYQLLGGVREWPTLMTLNLLRCIFWINDKSKFLKQHQNLWNSQTPFAPTIPPFKVTITIFVSNEENIYHGG